MTWATHSSPVRPTIVYPFASPTTVSTETPLLPLTELGAVYERLTFTLRNHDLTNSRRLLRRPERERVAASDEERRDRLHRPRQRAPHHLRRRALALLGLQRRGRPRHAASRRCRCLGRSSGCVGERRPVGRRGGRLPRADSLGYRPRGVLVSDGPTIDVERAAELLHCCRARVFQLIASGDIEAAPRFGRKTVVVTASVLEAIARGPRRAGRARRVSKHLPPPVSREGVRALLDRPAPRPYEYNAGTTLPRQ
jgi:hypothetical protein